MFFAKAGSAMYLLHWIQNFFPEEKNVGIDTVLLAFEVLKNPFNIRAPRPSCSCSCLSGRGPFM
jgi:hypothetical protein